MRLMPSWPECDVRACLPVQYGNVSPFARTITYIYIDRYIVTCVDEIHVSIYSVSFVV
jgi:hypothetical protein